jgi:hypothetical protein
VIWQRVQNIFFIKLEVGVEGSFEIMHIFFPSDVENIWLLWQMKNDKNMANITNIFDYSKSTENIFMTLDYQPHHM